MLDYRFKRRLYWKCMHWRAIVRARQQVIWFSLALSVFFSTLFFALAPKTYGASAFITPADPPIGQCHQCGASITEWNLLPRESGH
jgi:hypothetical protein